MEVSKDSGRYEYESPFSVTIEICSMEILCESPDKGESEGTDEEVWPYMFF